MKRGDIVTVVVSGDYGKPRPAVIVQTDALGEEVESLIVCLITSFDMPAVDFRLTLEPSQINGLKQRSHVMADKPVTVHRSRVGSRVGRMESGDIQKLNSILTFVMGLSD